MGGYPLVLENNPTFATIIFAQFQSVFWLFFLVTTLVPLTTKRISFPQTCRRLHRCTKQRRSDPDWMASICDCCRIKWTIVYKKLFPLDCSLSSLDESKPFHKVRRRTVKATISSSRHPVSCLLRCWTPLLSWVVYKSRQLAKFAGFSARFHRLLSLLHESKYFEEMDPQPSTCHKTPAT